MDARHTPLTGSAQGQFKMSVRAMLTAMWRTTTCVALMDVDDFADSQMRVCILRDCNWNVFFSQDRNAKGYMSSC